ncbi:hypothetical protein [Halocatena marina]|uniref:hypothetical protein n=1 Tax=Halocatena marina TaxID=2934937 RepID=UPI00200D9802|nr:hypothetical protein [Halocatena marina]
MALHAITADDDSMPETAAAHLETVNLCGSRSESFQVGHDGPVDVLGYSYGGDVYANLDQSILSLRKMK